MPRIPLYSSIAIQKEGADNHQDRDVEPRAGESGRGPLQLFGASLSRPRQRWLSYATVAVAFAAGLLIATVVTNYKYTKMSVEPVEAFVNVTIDGTRVVNLASGSDHGFACVTLDFWPADKCDYGHCSWINASVLTLPLSGSPETRAHEHVRKALEAMSKIQVESSPYSFPSKSPVILRLGGSTADLMRYDVNSTGGPWNCTDFVRDKDSPIGYEYNENSGPCLSMERWDEILSLCKDDTCRLVYDINAVYGRRRVACENTTSCEGVRRYDIEGEWDESNAEAFLQYTKEKGHNVWGFEFGNELAGQYGVLTKLSADEYVAGFCKLKRVIARIWSDKTTRPKILGPDSAFQPAWYTEFLTKAHAQGCAPDVVNWHQYILGAGVDPKVDERSLDPDVLDSQKWHGDQVMKIVRSVNGIEPEIWMGEAGGAYNSGRPGVTDTFHSSFWFLDSLGVLAARGHQAFCRQTLIGGNYGLLDRETYEPNPDYYALLLFQRLMGTNVLKTYEPAGEHSRYLRLYAHCSRRAETDGSVTILLLNLSETTKFHVSLLALQGDDFDFRTLGHTSWVIAADSLNSKSVSLNGGPSLHTSKSGDIPVLKGHFSSGGSTRFYSIEPRTYAFVRLDGTSAASVCRQDD